MKSSAGNLRTLASGDELYDLWTLLSLTEHAFERARDKELARYGISATEADALFIIDMLGQKAAPTEVSRWFLQEVHSISELLSRMEKKGLVRRVKGPYRQSRVQAELTEKGKESLKQAMKRESVHNITSALAADKRRQLTDFLTTLRNTALREFDRRQAEKQGYS